MEASAFLMLCTYFHIGCLGVVKGVSDLGDSNTAEHPDTYEDALKKTAHAIRKWSIYYLATVQWKINEDFEAGAHIVKGYYDNFIRVVLDAVGGEHDVAIKKSPGKKGNLARTLYYKAGYLIDFPRVINGLVEGADAVHQTRVFQRALKMKPYFKSTFSSGSPLATVESWQEYEKFLQKNPGPEKFDEETLLL
ncbi:hypothetical protein BKA61DRAFT_575293 [Leptodontidium sp. MPI-SDFR-AT-0119]|nr:hypothetical protein BKA61DRAFT_575293 [Leptodontidium sp. MPI-SDFR-AT-0119]